MAKRNDQFEENNVSDKGVENQTVTPPVADDPELTAEQTAAQTVAPDPEPAPKADKSKRKSKDDKFETLVEETMNGVHGTGRERMLSLGTNYAAVQTEIARRMRQ